MRAKCILVEAGEQGKSACCNTQLCAGHKAGIEGLLHAVKKIAVLTVLVDMAFWPDDNSQWARNPMVEMERVEEGMIDKVEREIQVMVMEGETALGDLMKAVWIRDN